MPSENLFPSSRLRRALVKYLDDIPDEEITELNIPTGIPLVYELDRDLRPIRHYYLASDEQVAAAVDAVANQGKAKWNWKPSSRVRNEADFSSHERADWMMDSVSDSVSLNELPYSLFSPTWFPLIDSTDSYVGWCDGGESGCPWQTTIIQLSPNERIYN